jgi:predicted kinase
MQCVIFIGIQASGKTTFFRERFDDTHVRVSLDLLRTRHREKRLFETCLELRQPCVVDNTSPRVADRARYIVPARAAGFQIAGYYFSSSARDALTRNEARVGAKRIPDVGLLGTLKQLERPTLAEGFDALHFVRLAGNGFVVEPWNDAA